MNGNQTHCPECEAKLKLGGHPRPKQQVICPKCQSRLWVVRVNPLELDLYVPAAPTKPRQKAQTANALCPECEQVIKLPLHVREGQQVICKACDTLLEVVNLYPLELDLASMIDYGPRRQSKYEEDTQTLKKQPQVWR